MTLIYKIMPDFLWEGMQREGIFRGAPVDLADGYIHFSTAGQVRETAAKHFADQTDLMLVVVDAEPLGEALRWEVSRGGERFPHLYQSLSLEAVVKAQRLPLGADGAHLFPELPA